MAESWFCNVEGRQIGPLTTKQIKALAGSGRIDSQTPVRRGHDGKWRRATAFRGLLPEESAEVSAPPVRKRRPPVAAEMPVAEPVAAPAIAVAVPAGVAVGTAVPSTPKTNIRLERNARRKSNTPLIAVAVIALLGAFAFAGGTAYFIITQAMQPAVAVAPTPSAVVEETAAVPAAPVELTDQERLAVVDKWRDASTTTINIAGAVNAKVAIEAAWIGGDPNGASTLSDTAATERALGFGSPPPRKPAGPRYLFVRVAVMNDSQGESLQYAGWNATGSAPAITQARVYGDQNNPLQAVSMSELSDSERRTTTVLKSGEAIADLLVFHAPAYAPGAIRLILPGPAIGADDKQYGFEIPTSMLGQPRRTAIVSWYETVEPTATAAATPAVVTAPLAPRPRANRPADLSELATRPAGDDTPVANTGAPFPTKGKGKPATPKTSETTTQPETIDELKAMINDSKDEPVERKPSVGFAPLPKPDDGEPKPAEGGVPQPGTPPAVKIVD